MLRSSAVRCSRCPVQHSFRSLSSRCRIQARYITHIPSKAIPRVARHSFGLSNHGHWTPRCFSTSSAETSTAEDGALERGELPDAFLARPRNLSEEDAWAVVKRSQEVWPPLQGTEEIADVWSSDWAQWPHLFALYWHSSNYLMIPSVEMFVNLQYGIEGETRPLLYSIPVPDEKWETWAKEAGADPDSPQNDYLLFTIIGKEKEVVYIANLDTQDILQLFEGDEPVTVDTLVPLLSNTDRLRYELLPPSEEGCKLLDRIFARDSTVRETLGEERWLGMVPPDTQPWQEWSALPENAEESLENEIEEEGELEEYEESQPLRDANGDDQDGLTKVQGGEAAEGEDVMDDLEQTKLSEEELGALQEARQLGLTKDLDEMGEMMEDAEQEIERTVQRFGEVMGDLGNSSSSPSDPAVKTNSSSIADDTLASDPEAVNRAVEHILSGRGTDALSISQLRGLSVEQLAEVQERLEVVADELERAENEAASAWKQDGVEGLETSRLRDVEDDDEDDDDRIRVRLPYKSSESDSDGPKRDS
ncbi:hypothetical protein PQX77_012407 [Marasmius sp. AFHP31]|nr:hypothetical protein PQX77_012407 [Marasmius sp. AFHP31]